MVPSKHPDMEGEGREGGRGAGMQRGREERRNPQGVGAVGLLPRRATAVALVGDKEGDVLHPKQPFAKSVAEKLRGGHKDRRA